MSFVDLYSNLVLEAKLACDIDKYAFLERNRDFLLSIYSAGRSEAYEEKARNKTKPFIPPCQELDYSCYIQMIHNRYVDIHLNDHVVITEVSLSLRDYLKIGDIVQVESMDINGDSIIIRLGLDRGFVHVSPTVRKTDKMFADMRKVEQ